MSRPSNKIIKGSKVMKVRGAYRYQIGKVIDLFVCRGVACALVEHKTIVGRREYFTSTIKQLEILERN